jgi:phytoene dehydrogenase-like protein
MIQTLYQKFAFIKAIIGTDEFAEAIHRIVTAPATKWTETREEKDIRNTKRFSNSNVREILKGGKRTKSPETYYLKCYGIDTLPERITTIRKSDSVDTPENRFIKHAIENYLSRNEEKYNLTSGIFLEKSLHKLGTYLSLSTLKALALSYKLDINQSLNETNKAYFKDEKLVQLFNRYATYNGSSPYKTPGIMSMIPHLEMNLGTYLPKGGMKEISGSLFELAKEKGVQFKFNEEVQKILIENKKAK